ncbi:hypothetical protein [Pelistega sp. MC2]|uniref:hypothetical protein n=1 Tax=Pelistega sp. MC2 TaxID=1720297 RepID=UPI00115F92B5|nr:hypothetical protein [Pelistega sp. MC2]
MWHFFSNNRLINTAFPYVILDDCYGLSAKVGRSGVKTIYLEHVSEGRSLKFIENLARKTTQHITTT